MKRQTAQGRVYYVNTHTQEIVWDLAPNDEQNVCLFVVETNLKGTNSDSYGSKNRYHPDLCHALRLVSPLCAKHQS